MSSFSLNDGFAILVLTALRFDFVEKNWCCLFTFAFGAILTADFNSSNFFFRRASKVFFADEIWVLRNFRASSSTCEVSPTSEFSSVRDLIILSHRSETFFAAPVVTRLNVFSIASSL